MTLKLLSLALRLEEEKAAAATENSLRLELLDQTLLPHEERWIQMRSTEQMIEAIQKLRVRGAPLIGVAAALMLYVHARRGLSLEEIKSHALRLRAARPTAVNLMYAIDRCLQAPSVERLEQSALSIFHEDTALCERMALNGQNFIQSGDRILTHCNTGGLATAGVGTALGVLRLAHQAGKKIHVWVDETRPLLQGARLTSWELAKLGVPHTLICDNMAATLMAQKKVDKVFVGADRIARNGDFANKIGTYGLAVLAKFHQIPFYVVAPRTTFDEACLDGSNVHIEERDGAEVRGTSAASSSPVYNPAFDVTPSALVTQWIHE